MTTPPKTNQTNEQEIDITQYHLTDMGNADLLYDLHKDNIRYDVNSGYYVFDGTKWVWDKKELMLFNLAMDVSETFRSEAINLRKKGVISSDQYDELFAHAGRCESLNRLKSMVTVLKSFNRISPTNDWDKYPYLLNTPQGVIDLTNGELIKHESSKHLLIRRITPVEYNKKAKCPQFDIFLDQITLNSKDLKRFIQKMIGSCLTGVTSDQKIFMWTAGGSNGKSTLMNVISALLGQGEYTTVTDFSSFLIQKSDKIRNDIASWRGMRLVFANECEEGKTLAASVIKGIAGSDPVTCRFLFKELFTYTPEYKVILIANTLPNITGTEHGIWRKIKVVPFNLDLREKDIDYDIELKLKEELPGILNWAIRGCALWQREGLGSCKEVDNATSLYREDNDIMGQFLDSRYVFEPIEQCEYSKNKIQAKDVFDAYAGWCKGYNLSPVNQNVFGRYVTKRNIVYKDDTSGTVFYRGIKLKR